MLFSTTLNGIVYLHFNILQLLEGSIIRFVKNELKKFQRVLSPDYPEGLESQSEDEEQGMSGSSEAILKITLDFLRRMKQDELADCLQNSKILYNTRVLFVEF